MDQVFISYSRKDISFVKQLAGDLENAGFDVWYDISDLSGGSRWRAEIESAIRNSQFVIAILSPDSIASQWVEREFLFSSNLNRKIIPLMYRSCELPLNYLDLNYIDVRGGNYQRKFPDILRALTLDPTKSTLSVTQSKKPTRRLNTTIMVASIVFVGMIIGSLLISPMIKQWLSPSTEPMITITTTTEYASSTSEAVFIATTTLNSESVTSTSSSLTEITLAPVTFSDPHPDPSDEIDPMGVPMRFVPAGEFTMGTDNPLFNEDAPTHPVYLDAYSIDKYEVTNAFYKACVDAGMCNSPQFEYSHAHTDYYVNSEFADHPVIYVDWNMARTYCEWRGAQLPTEAQWEKAARGVDGRTYPWGEDVDCTKANYVSCYGDPNKVGSYPSGVSPYGVYDMAGNVYEWAADWYDANYYSNSPLTNPTGPDKRQFRVVRGGTWQYYEGFVTTYRRTGLYEPDAARDFIGFRCAMDAP